MIPRPFLILVLPIIVSNVEVPELIHIPVLVRGDHPQPIADVVLLQVLLCQIFQVPLKDKEAKGEGGTDSQCWAVTMLNCMSRSMRKRNSPHLMILRRLTLVTITVKIESFVGYEIILNK